MKQVYRAPRKKRRFSVIAVCLLLTAVLAIGGTVAYLFTTSRTVTNTFNPVEPKVEIPEEMKETVKQNATVQNTGTVDSYLRAKIVVSWQNSNGDVLSTSPVRDTDYTISIGANWVPVGGYYYYNKVAAPGEPSIQKNEDGTTANPADCLIIKAEVLTPAPVDGYQLHIEVLGQGIQSTPDTAISESWKISPSAFIKRE